MRKQKGFTLIELLIVVAIILIIAAIAIPNLLRSKIAANEASAVGSTRTLVTSELTYNTSYGSFASLTALGTGGTGACGTPSSSAACLIDSSLANAGTTAKSGYLFGINTSANFSANAWPQTAGNTGNRSFCGTQDGAIRQSPAGSLLSASTTEANCQALNAI